MCYVIVLTGDLAVLVKNVLIIPQKISILFTKAYIMLFIKTIKLFINWAFFSTMQKKSGILRAGLIE